MAVSDEEFKQLSQRVQKLEDLLAIYRLLASYGPSVDSATDDDTRQRASTLWVEDGEYNVDTGVWKNQKEIEGMLNAQSHLTHLSKGCSHQVAAPVVTVDGDKATAIVYMSLMDYDKDEKFFKVVRQTANRWELRRTENGWRVVKRTNRLLDSREEARALLRDGMREVYHRLGKL